MTQGSKENAITRLKTKLESCYADYRAKWLQMTPAELIDQAEELESVTRMAKALPSSISEDDAEFLLHFKNPLEVISEAWSSANGIDSLIIDEEIEHIIWRLKDDQALTEDCEEFEGAGEEQRGVTVEEFLRKHPDAGLDMLTPCGYAYIPPGYGQEVLNGGKVIAHLGVSGTDFYLEAEVILNQEIASVNQKSENPPVFAVLSDWPNQDEICESEEPQMTM